jgi:hypothetical protein
VNLRFETVEHAAAELKRRHFAGYYLLPHNRIDLDRSQHWWLSPTPDANRASF